MLTLFLFTQPKSLLDAVTKARIATKNIESLTYNFTEDDARVVEELKCMCARYYEKLPHKEGLMLCHTNQQSRQYICRKVQRAKATLRCSLLP